MTVTDNIWNRAAIERGGSSPRTGDVALAALLRLHSQAMSSGLLHAVTDGLSPEEIEAALAGYRYFGLDDVAQIVESVASQAQIASDDELDTLEGEADFRYGEAVPQDAFLVGAFEARATQTPEEFAPIG
jgi:hypothetical protein